MKRVILSTSVNCAERAMLFRWLFISSAPCVRAGLIPHTLVCVSIQVTSGLTIETSPTGQATLRLGMAMNYGNATEPSEGDPNSEQYVVFLLTFQKSILFFCSSDHN